MRKTKTLNILLIFTIIISAGVIVRAIGFARMNVIFRDSVGFCIHAGNFINNPAKELKQGVQEPIHPAILAFMFKQVFPNQPIRPYGLAKYWQKILFFDGLLFTCIASLLILLITSKFRNVTTGLWATLLFVFHREAVILSINGMSELPYLTFFLLSLYLIYTSAINERKLYKILFALLAGIAIVLALLTRKEGLSLIIIALIFFILFVKRQNLSLRLLSSASIIIGFAIGIGIFYSIGGRFHSIDTFFKHCVRWKNLTHQIKQSSVSSSFIIASVRPTSLSQLILLPISGLFEIGGYLPCILFIAYWPLRKRIKAIPTGATLLILALIIHLALAIFYVLATGLFVRRYLFVSSVLMIPFAAAVICYLIDKYSVINRHYAIGNDSDIDKGSVIDSQEQAISDKKLSSQRISELTAINTRDVPDDKPTSQHLATSTLTNAYNISDNKNKHKRQLRLIALSAIIITAIMAPQGIWRYIKNDYRREFIETAQWINSNTPENSVIFVSDIRLGFYSNRRWDIFQYDPKLVRMIHKRFLTKKIPCYVICPSKAKFKKWNVLIIAILSDYKLTPMHLIPYKKHKRNIVIARIVKINKHRK